jgi:hypothetical protein
MRMLIDTVLRAARILQTAPGYSMPLVRLHAQLVRELGVAAGSYGEIYQQLKKRTDSFIVVDAARLLDGTESWPGVVREVYDAALAHAGLGSCVRVSLTSLQEGEATCDLLTALGATLAELRAGSAGDEALIEYLEHGTQQLVEMNGVMFGGTDRPTTLPPDPPLSG